MSDSDEHRRLSDIAARTWPVGAWRVYRGSYSEAADPALRDRPDAYFVHCAVPEPGRIVFESPDPNAVVAYLSTARPPVVDGG